MSNNELYAIIVIIILKEWGKQLNLFERINENFFKPLSGNRKQVYADIIALLWDSCKSSPTYSADKEYLVSELEAYFIGKNPENYDDEETEDIIFSEDLNDVPKKLSLNYLKRLKECGWLDERNEGYGMETVLSFNMYSVPIVSAFTDILNPKLITYKGKLFKIVSLLREIEGQTSPYEDVICEVHNDINELNNSLRSLGASISLYIDDLTRNKTPQEVLELFNEYEDKVVMASYHRFKTSDNLFRYKSEITERLEECEEDYLPKLALDCQNVEKTDYITAREKVLNKLADIETALSDMSVIMREIDKQHILYRSRAVQRAEFLLFTDRTVKGKLNNILKYYSETITSEAELFDYDDSLAGEIFDVTPQNGMSENFITYPTSPKKPTKITPLPVEAPLSDEEIAKEEEKLYSYIRNAMTTENINVFAEKVLSDTDTISASRIAEEYPDEFTKLIGLHTYSASDERKYDYSETERSITAIEHEFTDFTIRKKV